MRLVDGALVLLAVALAGYVIYRVSRWYFRPTAPAARATAWETRYSVEGMQTVWWIYRDLVGAGGTRRRERQEILRIDSAAADFDEQFLRGEKLAHERAFLLNSAVTR